MIYYLNKGGYSPRHYLNQWFLRDTLIVTDLDIWKCSWDTENHKYSSKEMQEWLNEHPCKNVVVDLSQNSFSNHLIPDCLQDLPRLSSMYDEWYNQTGPNIHFFPIWMYMYSKRNNFSGSNYRNKFDALGTKSKGVMCLNRGGRTHRVKFYNLMKDYEDRMCLTAPAHPDIEWQTKRLPGDQFDLDGNPANDVDVAHPVYDQYAVNVVTETQIEYPSLTEKCCKPFIARQIPIIVGNVGVAQFHVDIGFDMFEDLIPWRSWDDQNDQNIRLDRIANFVKQWIDSGNMLQDYNRVRDRVERNKQYFHSERFRNLIMKCMPVVDPY